MLKKGFKKAVLILCALCLASCATLPQNMNNVSDLGEGGYQALKAGHYQQAQAYFSRALQLRPEDCHLNFLNAMSYQLMAQNGDESKLGLAATGYKIAMRYCPQDPWPRYYYGLLAMQRKNYALATKLLQDSSAIGGSSRTVFLEAYLIAAYNSGHYRMAQQALDELKKAGSDNALVADMTNLIPTQQARLRKERIRQHLQSLVKKRAAKRRAATVKNKNHHTASSASSSNSVSKESTEKESPKQVIVDAVIIQSTEDLGSKDGVNLLNGLSLQYGGSFTRKLYGTAGWGRTARDSGSAASYDTVPFSSLVTSAISIPNITYSLNIFNSSFAKSEILARPTLVAEDGRPAAYFSGEKLLLGVTSQNSSSVETFPIGVHLRLLPHFLPDGSIDLGVEVGRDMAQSAQSVSTTFTEQASELSENVKTRVHVHYGETVILSGLSERAVTTSNNATPWLDRVPILKYLFSHNERTEAYNSVLILLTPEKYKSFSQETAYNSTAHLSHFFNTVVDPTTNLPAISRDLRSSEIFQKPRAFQKMYSKDTMLDAAFNEYQTLIDTTFF